MMNNAINIELELETLVRKEGGYTDGKTGASAKDSGGETMFGITVAVARAFGYTGAMKDMTRAQAKEIYRLRFWFQPRFHEVNNISGLIAKEMLDTGVNMGTVIAGKFLQRALNVLNRNGKLYPDIEVDGMVGNMTHACLREYLKERGKDGETVLFRMLNNQQGVRYMELAEARPKDEEFEYGWQLNRVE